MTMSGAAIAVALLLCAASASGEVARHKPGPSPAGRCPKCSGPDHAPKPPKFAFYFLVRQWPFNFCSTKQCYIAPTEEAGFTLHGLWPNLDNYCREDFPETCDSSDFDDSKIPGDVLDDMKTMWPSYTNDNDCFHNHEWQCHGTCSGLSQGDYFASVINLHKQYNIAEALENSQQSIKASDQPVSQADFTQALTDAFGYAPVLHCHNDKSSGNSYISEVFQCVDQNMQVMDCRDACKVGSCAPPPNQQCGKSIIYNAPDIRLGPAPSGCHMPCYEKSGTCH